MKAQSERTPDPCTDPVLRALRPLVEAYWAFWLESSRHIRSLRLTPAQFDIVVTLGETDGMTCSELSEASLLTKGTLTGVLDRLQAKGVIERAGVPGDRRCTLIRLTKKGDEMFHKVFPAHIGHIKPFFERALTAQEAGQLKDMLVRLRESFRKGGGRAGT